MPVALITGASTGIGNALAKELARRGWAVGLVARRAELLAGLCDEIRGAGGKAAFAAADVTDRAAIRAAAERLAVELGPIDLMVANAGSGDPGNASTVPVDAWMGTLRLNIDGVIYSVAAVLPEMVARRAGHLAVVSSVAGFRGLPGMAAYSASKACVTTFFESLRLDLKGVGVAVTAIHPGFIATPLTARNKNPMPFLISAERAATIIADGLEARRSDVTFPWQMKLLMAFARRLPNWLWDKALGRARPSGPTAS
ncbi:MAG: SDR family NAD(P)-dependent oxidoreductase [Myxococcales bacterium]|nr:SDR family NAD(P)-dependent oxidoreductase [Myxococcales bacterium]